MLKPSWLGQSVGKSSAAAFDKIGELVQAEWYLTTNPDVARAGVDPVEHFCKFGHREGRDPNPIFHVKWYRSTYMPDHPAQNPLEHFVRRGFDQGCQPNVITNPTFVAEKYGVSDAISLLRALIDDKRIEWLNPWFSRKAYRAANRDLSAFDGPIENHLIRHGFKEQRTLGPGLRITRTDSPNPSNRPTPNAFAKILESLNLEDVDYSIVNHSVPDEIINQIRRQADIDPDVTAIGYRCFPMARQFVATDLDSRGLIDHKYLLNEVTSGVDAVIILPRLQIGGAEKYAANLVSILKNAGQNCLVLTTDSLAIDDRSALDMKIFAPLRDVRIVPLREGLRSTWKPDNVMALLMLRVSPKQVFVVNSEPALKMIENYGRTLKNTMDLYCVFFSESPYAIGSPYSARYLRSVLPHARVISDNQPAIKKWRGRFGEAFKSRFELAPTFVDLPPAHVFEQTLSQRRARKKSSYSWTGLWISRWEPFKATDVLCEILRTTPNLEVDAFGPTVSVAKEERLPENLTRLGPINDATEIDISRYDFMIFTSYFEGMPNIVLEMGGMGIPIIASDVGGLRDTFGTDALALVDMDGDVPVLASRFKQQINAIANETPEQMTARLRRIRKKLELHHSEANVRKTILRLRTKMQ